MAERFRLLFQRNLFAGLQVGFFQLFQLEAEVIFILPALFGLNNKIFQVVTYLPVFPVAFLIVGQFLFILRQDVQNVQLEPFFVEQQVLVLTVYVNQFFAQYLHLRQRSRRIIDEGAAFPVGRYFPPDDAFLFVVFDVVLGKEVFQSVGRYPEPGFDDTLGRAVLDGFYVGPLAQQQSDGSQNDGFSGTGLAGNDRKARCKVNVQFVNQCVVLYIDSL